MTTAQVERTINVATAGSLSSYISEDEKYQIEKLTLTGEINGDDFGFLREMTGGVKYIFHGNEKSDGKLAILDMSGVKIVAGGQPYLGFDGSEMSLVFDDMIPSHVFTMCGSLKSIAIPNSVTTIGDYAFSYCSSLSSITIPNSVTFIDRGAFISCSSITSIIVESNNKVYDSRDNCNAIIETRTNTLIVGCKNTILPHNLTSIGLQAFAGCDGLISITIPNSVTSIGEGAFVGCVGLSSMTIPNSVTSIGERAFGECVGLTSITIPNCITSIGVGVFQNCKTLTNVIIPNSVISIDLSAFYGCSGLTSLTIGNNVTSIGNGAFSNCSSLTSVTIPNSVTSIGSGAFYDCSSLTSISIPNSVTSIGGSAFNGTPWYDNQSDGIVYAGNVLYKYKGIMPDDTNISIEEGTIGIAGAVFEGCSGLSSVTIPNSVTSIGSSAFSGCTGLTSVTIPNSVTSIGAGAFSDCTGLTSISLSNNITSIDNQVFQNCNSLTYVVIPNNVISIGGSAFQNCSGLTSVTIPNSVISVDRSAFKDCPGLTSLTIGNNVTSIGNWAFQGCCGLASVIIPNSVTSIGSGAFYDCSNLTAVTIGDGVTSFGSGVFAGTAWLDNQPDGIVYAGKVLYNYKGDMPDETTIGIKEGTIGIAAGAFRGCSGLTSVTIPNSVISIGESAFQNCSSLTSVTIPNSVKSIEGWAFSYCRSLTSVKVMNSVTNIGMYAFAGCRSIADFYCYVKDVPAALYAFADYSGIDYRNVKSIILHVPAESIDAYKATVPWKYFKEIVEIITAEISLNKSETIIEKGQTETLTATILPETFTDKSVTWKSSNTKVATVTSSGKVKGIKAGTATITCTSVVSGSKATCKVTVGYVKLDNTELVVEKTKTATLTATVYPSSLTDKSVIWKSSKPSVATVSSDGVVTGVKAGTATITCTSNATGLSTTCQVTVSYVKFEESEYILEKTKTLTLTPKVYPSSLEDKSVTWKSSNKSVAIVTSDGEVYGVKAGTATITCTSVATGVSTTCKVTVGYVKLDKTEAIVEKTKTKTLKATVYPSKLEDKSVTWKSSNESVATVTSSGKVKGIKAGKTTITCTSKATGLSTTCKVTVGYVKLDQTEVSVKKGKTLTMTATVYPSSLTDKSVTWESSNTAVATVTKAGKVKGIKAGMAIITCTSNATGLSAMCIVTVTATSGSRSLEGDDDEVTGIENLDEAPAMIEPFDVYDLRGQKVLNHVTSLDGLPAGIYIVNGKKVLKK